MIEPDPGVTAASPTPTPTRARNRVPKLLAAPQAMVAALHTATPMPSTGMRFQRSMAKPTGMPKVV
jgi:hypothetical protein